MPDAFELPWMLCSVVPLMRRQWFTSLGRSVVNELVAFAFGRAIRAFQFLWAAARRAPGFAAVVGALNDLPKPAARLRRVNAIWVNWRAFHVIDFPTRKMRAVDLPSFAFAVGCQDERTFSCTYQNSYSAHWRLLFFSFLYYADLDQKIFRPDSIITVFPQLLTKHFRRDL